MIHREVLAIGSLPIRIMGGCAGGLAVLCDILIVVGLCYYLRLGKSGFKRYVG